MSAAAVAGLSPIGRNFVAGSPGLRHIRDVRRTRRRQNGLELIGNALANGPLMVRLCPLSRRGLVRPGPATTPAGGLRLPQRFVRGAPGERFSHFQGVHGVAQGQSNRSGAQAVKQNDHGIITDFLR